MGFEDILKECNAIRERILRKTEKMGSFITTTEGTLCKEGDNLVVAFKKFGTVYPSEYNFETTTISLNQVSYTRRSKTFAGGSDSEVYTGRHEQWIEEIISISAGNDGPIENLFTVHVLYSDGTTQDTQEKKDVLEFLNNITLNTFKCVEKEIDGQLATANQPKVAGQLLNGIINTSEIQSDPNAAHTGLELKPF